MGRILIDPKDNAKRHAPSLSVASGYWAVCFHGKLMPRGSEEANRFQVSYNETSGRTPQDKKELIKLQHWRLVLSIRLDGCTFDLPTTAALCQPN